MMSNLKKVIKSIAIILKKTTRSNTFAAFHGQFDVSETPVALHISKRVLTLPLYAELSLEDVDRICEVILSCRK